MYNRNDKAKKRRKLEINAEDVYPNMKEAAVTADKWKKEAHDLNEKARTLFEIIQGDLIANLMIFGKALNE